MNQAINLSHASHQELINSSHIDLCGERPKGRSPMSKIVLPYEPDYVGGREAEKRRKQTQAWLRERELELELASTRSPRIVPLEHAPQNEKVK
jgi:hypothetical protein